MRKVEDRLLTIEEVSQLVGLSVTTIRNQRCQTNELIRIELKDEGSKKVTLRFSHNDVQSWIEKRTQAAQQRRAATSRKRPNRRTQTSSNLRLVK